MTRVGLRPLSSYPNLIVVTDTFEWAGLLFHPRNIVPMAQATKALLHLCLPVLFFQVDECIVHDQKEYPSGTGEKLYTPMSSDNEQMLLSKILNM